MIDGKATFHRGTRKTIPIRRGDSCTLEKKRSTYWTKSLDMIVTIRPQLPIDEDGRVASKSDPRGKEKEGVC